MQSETALGRLPTSTEIANPASASVAERSHTAPDRTIRRVTTIVAGWGTAKRARGVGSRASLGAIAVASRGDLETRKERGRGQADHLIEGMD
jgi:hypothetical protein